MVNRKVKKVPILGSNRLVRLLSKRGFRVTDEASNSDAVIGVASFKNSNLLVEVERLLSVTKKSVPCILMYPAASDEKYFSAVDTTEFSHDLEAGEIR